MMAVIQNRIEQKDWLFKHGFPVGRFRAVRSLEQLEAAVKELGEPVFLKSATGGYDGRGQAKLGFAGPSEPDDFRQAWEDVGEGACVAEAAIDLQREISVMVARSPSGEVKVYSPAENFHERQILSWSVIPASVSKELTLQAEEIARGIAETFALEGLLAVGNVRDKTWGAAGK